jgi:hypothetical protein
LAEVKNRFKIKNGDVEIEYEGPLAEVNKRYDEAFKWVSSQKPKTPEKKKDEKTAKLDEKKEKKDKRGGVRRSIYSEPLAQLEKEGFFEVRKSLDEVMDGLVPKNVPTRDRKSRNAVLSNLKRRINSPTSNLKGGKDQGKWYFWIG